MSVTRIGVYVDGYNLYYGARGICGRGSAGWRWLDLRSLSASIIAKNPAWASADIARIVFCTARINGATNRSGQTDQDIYLKALVRAGSVDLIEHGKYIAKVRAAPLATPDRRGRPVLLRSNWPVMVQDAAGAPVPDALFMVQVAYREEKGSDVNVASHLLLDAVEGNVDAAIVISNDSDLRFPIQQARERIAVCTVNPSKNYLAGDLKGTATDGVGGHWWYALTDADLKGSQLSNPVGPYSRPAGW